MILFMSDFSERSEFRRRPLSKQHKKKISDALKGRGSGKKSPTLEGHVGKGAKWGSRLGAGMGALNGALYGGAVAGPVGVPIGAALGGGSGYLSGAASGAGYGAGLYALKLKRAGKKWGDKF